MDLTVEEKLSIWNSLPNEVTKLSSINNSLMRLEDVGEEQEPGLEPSLLQRSVAWAIVQLCIMAHFLIPYIQFFVAYAYQYEREHHIAEKVLNSTISTADTLIRRGAQFADNVGKMSDGKAGQALNDLTVWWIRGVTGGIHDGVTEGMTVLGVEKRPAPSSSPRKL